MMKAKLLPFLFLIVLFSCKDKEPAEPKDQIEGTWKIQNLVLKDADGVETDFWVFAQLLYPCVTEIRYSFDGGEFKSTAPTGCATEAAETLGAIGILFQSNTGTYTLDQSTLAVNINGSVLPASISFDANTATIVTVDPSDLSTQIRIVFVKA